MSDTPTISDLILEITDGRDPASVCRHEFNALHFCERTTGHSGDHGVLMGGRYAILWPQSAPPTPEHP